MAVEAESAATGVQVNIQGRRGRSDQPVTRPRQSLWTKLRRWARRVELLGAERRRLCGMPVYALTDDASFHPLYFAKVGRALQRLEAVDPRRFRRLYQDIRRIVVSEFEGNHYDSEFRSIMLKWSRIVGKTAEENALTLVHEATHARIERWGVSYDKELRARIEAACVTQEVASARRFPEGRTLAEKRLEALETPWWTDEKLLESHVRELRERGFPEWLVRTVEFFRRRKLPQNSSD